MILTPGEVVKLQNPGVDPRVQAIRCLSCHRLRRHPKKEDPRSFNCGCGGLAFEETSPHDDELQIALKLYAQEIEESGVYNKISQEIILGISNS
jgi:hypothetical protein